MARLPRLAARSNPRFTLARLRKRDPTRTLKLSRWRWRNVRRETNARYSINLHRAHPLIVHRRSPTALCSSIRCSRCLAQRFAPRESQDEGTLHGDASPLLPCSCDLAFIRFLSIPPSRSRFYRVLYRSILRATHFETDFRTGTGRLVSIDTCR
jgi:hypothetical protein